MYLFNGESFWYGREGWKWTDSTNGATRACNQGLWP